MSSTVISLTYSKVRLSPQRYRCCKSRRETRPSRRSNISSAGWAGRVGFERFMRWLGPDEELANQTYESIRSRLIAMFKARRCVFAEDLADATIERVARKMSDLTFRFSGDPVLFCYGVAKKIYLENQRRIMIDRKISASSLAVDPVNPDLEDMLQALDEALSMISHSDRELILDYYSGGTEKNKIDHRRALADKLGIGSNTLRLRVFRIRKEIKNYMLQFSAHTYRVPSERLKLLTFQNRNVLRHSDS